VHSTHSATFLVPGGLPLFDASLNTADGNPPVQLTVESEEFKANLEAFWEGLDPEIKVTPPPLLCPSQAAFAVSIEALAQKNA